MFRTTYLKSYKSNEAKHGQNFEEFGIPEEQKLNLQNGNAASSGSSRYDLLDEDDGTIGVGLRVSDQDVLIGKTVPVTTGLDGSIGTTNNQRGKIIRKDASIVLDGTEDGVVDSVLMAQNENGKRMSKVRIRQTRIPQVGDKLASNCAQKGVIGAVIAPEDMPFTMDGLSPDLVINTHALPSRMTINQMLVTLAGKLTALTGNEIDATAFQNTNPDAIGELLKQQGYERHGWEQMYSGISGEPIPALIFIGPTYYQRLKHMVDDKNHSRKQGKVQTLTKQPTEGKSKGGGLRSTQLAFVNKWLISTTTTFICKLQICVATYSNC